MNQYFADDMNLHANHHDASIGASIKTESTFVRGSIEVLLRLVRRLVEWIKVDEDRLKMNRFSKDVLCIFVELCGICS